MTTSDTGLKSNWLLWLAGWIPCLPKQDRLSQTLERCLESAYGEIHELTRRNSELKQRSHKVADDWIQAMQKSKKMEERAAALEAQLQLKLCEVKSDKNKDVDKASETEFQAIRAALGKAAERDFQRSIGHAMSEVAESTCAEESGSEAPITPTEQGLESHSVVDIDQGPEKVYIISI
mmetsp:Transcript_18097/g.31723  ORF Transcript_18097/g.31723 Transcript_18097/m.31723 type:complete len:178 (-) Transcript_18097:132-665(-)|eukprot:CAMPEP_0197620686 /NCGR_PEP_ID=MMETSP1338-20131121/1472_1 /TAXON_ID=43686 ORGANISM="Pelagodinium beii, Strain RCC1491" /NCGR_SAMPLE_ID=MMETSP1338 /ASSEMBLY_ACC=CAM_ASM_000754 /LENGTH=177 /DNA_ID=CAMNT_0043189941 /DNA_START=50 /DNA_END=583 /DNA_ORIENTATION=+